MEISDNNPVSLTGRERYVDLTESLNLGSREDIRSVVQLTGGVASDIVLVELEKRKV